MEKTTDKFTECTHFMEKFEELHRASVGIIIVPTRDVMRVTQVLAEWSSSLNLPAYVWNIVDGWGEWDASENRQKNNMPESIDPMTALKHLDNEQKLKKTGKNGKPSGIFMMQYPHFNLADKDGSARNPAMLHLLKTYAYSFTCDSRRLVLIVPTAFNVPHELQDDVVVLDYNSPSYAEREVILMDVIATSTTGNNHNGTSSKPSIVLAPTPEELTMLVNITSGMTTREVQNSYSRSVINAYRKQVAASKNKGKTTITIEPSDMLTVLAEIKTSVIKRSDVLELMESGNMGEIGGLDNLKAWIAKRAACFTDDARSFGVDTPKGVALIGPPGTGKSLAAKAVASVLKVPMIRFDVSRVFNSLVGSSEARVRDALRMVDSLAPCVLMIDEIDKVFQQNSSQGDSGVSQRVLGTLLTWMNDTQSPVFLVVTANRVDNLPAEFLRKGRLDEVFSVSLPSPEDRAEIINIHLRKRGKEILNDDDLMVAVDASDKYVPSEIEAAVKEAIVEAFASKSKVSGSLIAEQLLQMVPLSTSFAEQFDAMETWAANNARPASVKHIVHVVDKVSSSASVTTGNAMIFDD